MRITEALTRRWNDLEIRPEGYARIALSAAETKAKYRRYSFITTEILEWLRAVRTSEWLFTGFAGEHLSYNGAQVMVKQYFREVGCIDKPDKSEHYTLHSFRTLAGDLLRECGLGEREVLAIIGHKNKALGVEVAYLDWKKVEANWREKRAEKMSFLDTGAVAQKQVADLTRTNGKLEALLEKLLEKL